MKRLCCVKNSIQKSYNKFMRTIYCFCSLLLLTACAGTPPAWWDPAGTYSGQSAAAAVPASGTAVAPAQNVSTTPIAPLEEEIEPLQDDMYEEMNLSVSGEVIEPAAKNVSETKTETKVASVSNEPAQAMKELSEAEDLPADGSLPAPSVLK